MQFYKLEGLAVDEKWSDENNNRKAMSEKVRNISTKTDCFNQHQHRKVYIFVKDASKDVVTVGAIIKNCNDVLKVILEYLKVIEIELKDIRLEEITLNTLENMLRHAARNDYIYDDDDDILEQFELNRLSSNNMFGRAIDYEEDIIDYGNKKIIYYDAVRFRTNETLIPELDRIYAGGGKRNTKYKVTGHPVHYMIETDDEETFKGMYKILLQALYANKRLENKRYTFAEFNPDMHISISAYNCLYKSNVGGTIIVKYCSNSDIENDYACSDRETIEILCEAARKYQNQVLTVFCLPRECTKLKDIFYEYLGNISIVELKEEFVTGERAKDFLKMMANDNGVRADEHLFAKLEENKGYLAPELHDIFDVWYNNKLKTGVYPQYRDIVTVKREIIKAMPKGSAYDELNQMIGLGEAKKVIDQALNYYKAQKLFADKGMKNEHTAMHMAFTGNPGTAKTTVARLFARIMKENDILSKGDLIEVGRGDLVGKYVGWTAPTIQNKFKQAKGSVLFIDEAYSLVDDRDGSFGDEAINTIVQEMENHRDDVVVIFAGYPDKMENFLNKNPGLRSRIAYHVPFDDYDTESLCKIAKLIAKQKGLTFTEEAVDKLTSLFDAAKNASDFGNGRFVRNVIEKARMAQATRLLTMEFDSIKSEDISTITAEDIEMPDMAAKSEKIRIGFCA